MGPRHRPTVVAQGEAVSSKKLPQLTLPHPPALRALETSGLRRPFVQCIWIRPLPKTALSARNPCVSKNLKDLKGHTAGYKGIVSLADRAHAVQGYLAHNKAPTL